MNLIPHKREWLVTLAILSLTAFSAESAKIITLPSAKGMKDATKAIQKAIDVAGKYDGKEEVIIRLSPGVYNISRKMATPKLQHITNTTTVEENPDPTKHFGLYLHDKRNITIDGNGAVLVTHGEMTALAIDSCNNIAIRNLTIKAADPSVIELKVTGRTDSTILCEPIQPAAYRIDKDGRIYWYGEGWEFTGGIAQLYDGTHTWRCESPSDRYTHATATNDAITFHYYPGEAPSCQPGQVYQLRHSYRTEVAAFINRSEDVKLENVTYNFLGNFGIVGQFSKNVTLENVSCAPDPVDGRTCAGFADFVQMSGCRGLVKIKDCNFSGAHDDPINVHGTHLKVVDVKSPEIVVTRYMHGQTFGFQPFEAGDEIAVVDAESLRRKKSAVVTYVRRINDYDWEVGFDRDIQAALGSIDNAVIENVSATPDVEITGCRFTLTPTRGLLLSTSGKCSIEDNLFLNIPMSAILIADDARSWYESGPVRDVIIRNNRFVNCASPVINISPENNHYEGPVHENISIEGNYFEFTPNTADISENSGSRQAPDAGSLPIPISAKDAASLPILISAKAVDGLKIRYNSCNVPANPLQTSFCTNIETDSWVIED